MAISSTRNSASGIGGDADRHQRQEGDQRDEAADHEDVAVGEIDHADDAVDHRVADGDQAVDRAERDAVDELLDEIFHASDPLSGRVCSAANRRSAQRLQFRCLAGARRAGQRGGRVRLCFCPAFGLLLRRWTRRSRSRCASAAPSPCSRSWRRGRCWRRGGRCRSGGWPRWPSNLGIVVVDALLVRLVIPTAAVGAVALCRRPRHRPVPLARPAALGRGAARVPDPRPRHLRPARRVPPRAVAVAAAPHAPRRPRHRRQHRACAFIRSRF